MHHVRASNRETGLKPLLLTLLLRLALSSKQAYEKFFFFVFFFCFVGTFDSVGSTELQDAGKAGLVTVQGKISAVLGTVLICKSITQ